MLFSLLNYFSRNDMGRTTKPNSHRTRLEDVARQAGVSVTTASLALSDKSAQYRISEAVVERVRATALSLDYTPNRLVRSLQRGSTHILSFVNGFRNRLVNDIYMDRLSTAIERAAGSHGYDILVNCDFSRTPRAMYQHLNGGVVDGVLLFAPTPDDPLLSSLRTSRLPVVLINAHDTESKLSSVRDDVALGMRLVADRLAALGHRRIAAFTETEENRASRDTAERVTLLRQFLLEHDIELTESNVCPYYKGQSDALLQQLLTGPDAVTAIFCWRDRLAYFVLEDCDRLGISVPEQVSVIGYDGLMWPAVTRHTVASVHVDLESLADAAVTLLLRQLAAEVVVPELVRLPVVLKDGTTLAPPANR